MGANTSQNGDWRARLGALRLEWQTLGIVGKTALVALAVSALVGAGLGLAIPDRVEDHLVDAHIAGLTRIAEDLARRNLLEGLADPESLKELDEAVREELLGAGAVRTKVWSPEGVIIYSDVPELIGRRYPMSPERSAAFSGEPTARPAVLGRAENVFERELGPLFEYYVPVFDASGRVQAVFEVYEEAEALLGPVERIRRYVWVTVAIGVGLLGVFLAVLFVANGRIIQRRRRQAERLLHALVYAQDEERKRIVGALHDDVAQNLYRLHYGLEHCRAHVDDPRVLMPELDHLRNLVHEVDSALRAELRQLRRGSIAELGLATALRQLAAAAERETSLRVDVLLDRTVVLPDVYEAVLFQAAQEALTNVWKHARAAAVTIDLRSSGGRVDLIVDDDGVGIDESEGLGLGIIRERLESIGGGLEVRRRRGAGTRFRAWVPLLGSEVG